MPTSAQDAEDLAADVLVFLARDPERLARFFILTGLRADTIREASRAPGFAASVLDYILADERLLLAFASVAEVEPEELAQVRRSLNRAPEQRLARAPTVALVRSSNVARRFGGA
jgi:hypothetical protein